MLQPGAEYVYLNETSKSSLLLLWWHDQLAERDVELARVTFVVGVFYWTQNWWILSKIAQTHKKMGGQAEICIQNTTNNTITTADNNYARLLRGLLNVLKCSEIKDWTHEGLYEENQSFWTESRWEEAKIHNRDVVLSSYWSEIWQFGCASSKTPSTNIWLKDIMVRVITAE